MTHTKTLHFSPRWGLAVSVLLLPVTFFASGCATNPVTGKQDFVMMSEDQEIALGRKYNQEVLKEYQVYDNPELQRYVERIGEELGADSHRKNLVYHFTVLDDPMVNAFALPGGYVYITRGIMAYMNSEAQLAGVLGHEIGHVTARHSVRQQAASTVTGLLGAAAAIATGNRAIGDASNLLGTALVRGYGRNHELEADRLGAEYLARAGYDPEEMIDVIGILKDQDDFSRQQASEENRQSPTYHGVFSTHPRNDQRLQEVIEAARKFQTGTVPRKIDDNAFIRMLDGMVFGDSEEQGILRGERFYHRGLDFTLAFPKGWRVQNQPDSLTAVADGDSAFIQFKLQDQNKRGTPREYLYNTFSDLDDGRTIELEGNQAYSGLTQLKTPFGLRPTRVAAIYHDKKIFLVAAAARQGVVQQPFFDTVKSFRRLHRSELPLAKALRIKVIKAKPGDTFARLARNAPEEKYAEEHLRLINGMYPHGEPQPGQLIKILQ